VQATEEYLTIEKLSVRLDVRPKTIRNKMASGVFQKGVHYFRPKGLRPRFKWSAIVAWLEERDKLAAEQPADAVPMARGYLLGSGKKSGTLLTRQGI
jgi:hypothetical protein